MGVANKGLTPDLRMMSEETRRLFTPIVLEGLYRSVGMIGFADVLSEDEVDDIHDYINAATNSQLDEQQQPGWLTRIEQWVLDKIGLILAAVL
jgi:mono/diheme cytochrome c family protein